MSGWSLFSPPSLCVGVCSHFRPFIKYCMKRVNMLLKYDITPVMVFDGGYLPLKDRTERERRE